VSHHAVAVFLIIVLAAIPAASCSGADGSDAEPPASPTAAAAAPRFIPGMDDLMTMLVAPRHAKLHYAGVRRNWELAAFEMKELRSAFRRIVASIPVYLDRNVVETIDALMKAKLDATDAAIATGDAAQFTRAYGELTAACNACHAYLEHPFLVIKVPDTPAQSAFPAQEFKPATP
jgi:hypothetical protein